MMFPIAACTSRVRRALVVLALVPCLARAEVPVEDGPAEPSRTEPSASVPDDRGFLYGRVVTDVATYEGRLRWGREEAFWDDHFNGNHDTRRWRDAAEGRGIGERPTRREPLEIFGIKLAWRWDERNLQHASTLRFGDIDRLDIDGQEVEVRLKGGERLVFDGGSNDIGATLQVDDPGLGTIELRWKRIERVEFQSAPPVATKADRPQRLYGTLTSRAGTFTGYIQWDIDECLTTDVLDGEDDDGEHEIPMGRIQRIERRSRTSARVTLIEGRTLELSGSNDVNVSNAGIFVETADRGRVLVSWDSFESLDLMPAPGSGPGYDDYPPARPLHGRVLTRDGRQLAGRLVYDLDESTEAEILNGEAEGVEYHVPFGIVSRIEPRGDDSHISLRSGHTLTLSGSADVDRGNGGVLVFTDDRDEPTYIRWRDVDLVDFGSDSRELTGAPRP